MGRIICLIIRLDTLLKRGAGVAEQTIKNRVRWVDIDSAFGKRMRTSIIANIAHIDVHSFLDDVKILFTRYVKKLFKENYVNALKINAVLLCKYKQELNSNGEKEEKIEEKHFNTKNVEIFLSTDLDQWFNENIKTPLTSDIEEFQDRDSGWSLHSILNIQININKYNPMRSGSSYIPLPKFIQNKKACINVQNSDNQCFKWSILAALHLIPRTNNPHRLINYLPYAEELNMKNIDFPVPLGQIQKFEKQNSEISVNVFGLNGKNIVPLCLTSSKKLNHVNLLLIKEMSDENEMFQDTIFHYVYIQNLSRLVGKSLSHHKEKCYICDRCLHFFNDSNSLAKHEIYCSQLNNCRINLPEDGKNIIEFKNYKHKEKIPFIIYADCECLLKSVIECKNEESNTTVFQRHEIFSIGYYLKCSYNDCLSYYRSYRGKNAALWFATELKCIAKFIENVYCNAEPMETLTLEQNVAFFQAETCHICCKPFNNTSIKVHDHSHIDKTYRGPAHVSCNLNYKDSRIIPVVFHNLSGYDAHFIIQDVSNHFPGKVDLLPLNKERYIAFTKHIENSNIKFRFIDSFKFMASSLDKLASYLDEYNIIYSQFPGLDEKKVKLLTRKGILPYEYIDSWEKLDETKLPAKDKFYSTLNDSNISDEDYNHAQKIWNVFNIKSLGEYSDLYMKTDILLLADVFENFRHQCMKSYGLDPAHYYTTPGFSWDAMLKCTGVKLSLLTDIDMLLFIECGIRGGLSQCSNRYAAANNKYMKDYKENEEDVYLMYFDANNLYGWAMTQALPYDSFEWVEDYENFNFNVDDNASIGYILEVDLDYPSEIHDEHNDLPFCPEHIKPPGSKQTKLCATLMNKRNYVIHYRYLKQAIAHGLRLVKIHKVLKFKQSPWLKSYIDLNSSMRANAKNEFEKNLFKLMNNAVYGKTMENVRKRVDVKLLTQWEGRYGLEAYISKPNFHNSAIFNENLVAVELRKVEILMDKPIYVGLTVLDVSKILMYSFHYDYMHKMYNNNNCKLLYTDTDSLIYSIKCNDIYNDIKLNIHYFDTSEYLVNNEFGIPQVNKKIVGLMKDECNGKILTEFVGLRSKMYSTRVNGEDATKKIKGIKTAVIKTITFNDYVNCLKDSLIQKRKQCMIRSKLHKVETIRQEKIALSPYDDKRCLQEGSTETLAWGHYNM